MTFWTRLRFLFGIIFVFLIVGLLVLYLNNAMSTVHATKAQLSADATAIGVDYPGIITKQYVNEGDKVSKGQTLFMVNSPQLASDIANRTVETNTLPYKYDTKSQSIVITANDDGVIEKINNPVGSYVQGGSVLGSLDTLGTYYVSAHFHLTPPDYARLKNGNQLDVTFPDNSTATAQVYSISLVSDGGTVDTVVKGHVHGTSVSNSFRFPVDTPVEASLKLTQRTWYQDVTDFVRRLFKPSAQ